MMLALGRAWATLFKDVVPDGEKYCGCERRRFTVRDPDEVTFVLGMEDDEIPLDRSPLR